MSYKVVVNGKTLTPAQLREHRRKMSGSGKLQEMLESRQAPGSETDSTFMSNFGTLEKQFNGDQRYLEALTELAGRDGHKINPNSAYIPTLAQYPGDPRAFVSDRGEAVKVAEERGHALDINGRRVVDYQEPESDPVESAPKLADNLVAPLAAQARAEDPKLSVEESKEKVIEKHGFVT